MAWAWGLERASPPVAMGAVRSRQVLVTVSRIRHCRQGLTEEQGLGLRASGSERDWAGGWGWRPRAAAAAPREKVTGQLGCALAPVGDNGWL
jgi:hypothetical protein